jgi:3-deoxy-D-manno-octulosonic acid kinase
MINSGQRTATATGVMLADPHCIGNAPPSNPESLFDPTYWAERGELEDTSGGRGAAWFVGTSDDPWVLRHYRRGGFMARISQDRYLWAGEDRVRAFAEWRLLLNLAQRGLPVPTPIAAWYQRQGLTYRCDLLTRRVADASSLSSALGQGALSAGRWASVGDAIARLHAAGADHADLNAHNILFDGRQAVTVIDFDRGKLRAPGTWRFGNLQRLHRSLIKISKSLPPDRFNETAWASLLRGYKAVA